MNYLNNLFFKLKMDISSIKQNKVMKFGDKTIDEKIIFYKRKLVFAFTNLKPFMPGHVLLCPTRLEKSYKNMKALYNFNKR